MSYLNDRQQFVSFQTHKSSTAAVRQGIPQGSIQGPLLILIYMLPFQQIMQHYGSISIIMSKTHKSDLVPITTAFQPLIKCLRL